MAKGDVTSGLSSVADASSLTIQPASGIEWVVHNIYHGGSVTVEKTDGTNNVTLASPDSDGALSKYAWHVTNSEYVVVTNTSGGSVIIGYDGVVTAE